MGMLTRGQRSAWKPLGSPRMPPQLLFRPLCSSYHIFMQVIVSIVSSNLALSTMCAACHSSNMPGMLIKPTCNIRDVWPVGSFARESYKPYTMQA